MKHLCAFVAAVTFQHVAGKVSRVPVERRAQSEAEISEALNHLRRRHGGSGRMLQQEPDSLASRLGDVALQRNPSVPLVDSKTGHLFVDITIGDPPKQYEVVLDTGSTLLWVPDIECGSAQLSCENDFSIGDLKIKRQKFAGAGDVPVNLAFDGILGLGYHHASDREALSPLENMVAQGLLDEPLYSLYLASSDKHQSEVLFGGVDNTKFSGSLVNLPVAGKLSWDIRLESIGFGDDSFSSKRTTAVLDSGTPLIVLPTKIAGRINEAISHIGCDKLDQLPDLIIKLAGHKFEITPEDYISQKDDQCGSEIVGIDFDWFEAPVALLGDVFLRRWYSVFDHGNASVGLARAK